MKAWWQRPGCWIGLHRWARQIVGPYRNDQGLMVTCRICVHCDKKDWRVV